jgi:hypothetical protein
VTMMHLGEPSEHPPMEAVHKALVQNDGLPEASFIACSMPSRHVVVSVVQTGLLELRTAYVAPAWAAALACIRTNMPAPRSVTPSIKAKNIGVKMAVSTATPPSEFRRSCRIIFVHRLLIEEGGAPGGNGRGGSPDPITGQAAIIEQRRATDIDVTRNDPHAAKNWPIASLGKRLFGQIN